MMVVHSGAHCCHVLLLWFTSCSRHLASKMCHPHASTFNGLKYSCKIMVLIWPEKSYNSSL